MSTCVLETGDGLHDPPGQGKPDGKNSRSDVGGCMEPVDVKDSMRHIEMRTASTSMTFDILLRLNWSLQGYI